MDKKNNKNSYDDFPVMFDFDELTKSYAESLNNVTFGNKSLSGKKEKEKEGTGSFTQPEEKTSAEHEQIVDKIKEKNRILSQSIWTENPILKPQKSIWLDEEDKAKANVEKPVLSNTNSQKTEDNEIIKPFTMELKEKKPSRTEASIRIAPKKNPVPKKQVQVNPVETEKNANSNKKEFAVNIPNVYYKEYEKGASVASRPLVREELPKKRPAPPKPRTEQEKLADELKAAEYARQVQRNAQRAKAVSAENTTVNLHIPKKEAVLQQRPVQAQRQSVENASRPAQKPQANKRQMTTSERLIGEKTAAERKSAEAKKILEDYEKSIENHQTQKKKSKKQDEPKFKTHELEFNFINAIVCIVAVFGIFFSLIFMKRESGFIDSENRNLATFPKFSFSSYLSGDYTSDITTYFTDTIQNRETYKKFCSNFSNCLGVKLNDTLVLGNMKVAEKEELDKDKIATTTTVGLFTGTTTTRDKSQTTTTKKTTTTEDPDAPVDVPENLDDGAWEGNVIVSGSGENVRAVGAYYGTFENGTYYAETINKWKEDLGETVNVYNMSIPTSAAYYMPSNLADTVSDQKDNIDNIASGLKGIINVDVYNILAKHVDEYIYSRTDHHWQPLGAYYAATVFSDKAGLTQFPKLDTYEKCVIEGFCGTMYGYSNNNQELANNPDTFTYYKPDNEYTVTYYDTAFQNGYEGGLFFDYASGVNCYSAILNVDSEIAEIETDCDNGRVLVVFKDSFGNALIPYFTQNFSKIYVCDFRYFDLNAIQFCQDVGCTDLLFAISLTSCSTPSKVDLIDGIRTQ